MPNKAMKFLTWGQDPLNDVIPAAALIIAARTRNNITDFFGKFFIVWLRLEAIHPRQVPSNFQVVTDDRPVLLPTPSLIL